MNVHIKRLNVIFAFALYVCCMNNKIPPDARPEPAKVEFVLSVGETKELNGLRLKFVDVILDNRCPKDALCVWTGMAVVQLTANISKSTSNIYLGIFGDVSSTQKGSAFYMGNEFNPNAPRNTFASHIIDGSFSLKNHTQLSLTEIYPQREIGKEIKQSEYQIKFLWLPVPD